jgi:hypothetical protein
MAHNFYNQYIKFAITLKHKNNINMLYKLKLKRPEAKQTSLMTEFMKNGIPFKLYSGKTIQSKNWS